jgi:ribosomal-protein-alanine N-acetyltransferase
MNQTNDKENDRMDIPEQLPRVRIEPMSLANVEAVEELERECFSNPWSLDSLAEELSNPLAVFRVITVGGEIAGYAGMHHIIDEGYITNIAVKAEFRRQGVATALMRYLLTYAEENDMRMVTLEVRASNEKAIALYAGLKFEEVGCRRRFYTNPTEDALIMTRKI